MLSYRDHSHWVRCCLWVLCNRQPPDRLPQGLSEPEPSAAYTHKLPALILGKIYLLSRTDLTVYDVFNGRRFAVFEHGNDLFFSDYFWGTTVISSSHIDWSRVRHSIC
jgi:hypothetical protein